MKKIIIVAMSVLISAGPLMAQTMEGMRKSSEAMSIDAASLKKNSPTSQYEITPTPVFEQLITNLLKLLFGANGDIEISNPPGEVPQVEGTLSDDQTEERYDAGTAYTPIDPADLQEAPAAQPPQGQQPQGQPPQDVQYHPQAPAGGENRAGVVPEDLKRKALEYFNANSDKIIYEKGSQETARRLTAFFCRL